MKSGRGVKPATFENWRQMNKYFRVDITRKVLTCHICVKWKTKLHGTNAFNTGSPNLKSSVVTKHVQSKLHKQALRLEEQGQAATEDRNVRVQLPPVPPDALIAQAAGNMGRLTPEKRNGLILTSLIT